MCALPGVQLPDMECGPASHPLALSPRLQYMKVPRSAEFFEQPSASQLAMYVPSPKHPLVSLSLLMLLARGSLLVVFVAATSTTIAGHATPALLAARSQARG